MTTSESAPDPTAGEPGLEARFYVRKMNDPTGKHAECRYFVLDPQHDPVAREALVEYARRTPHKALRRDLWDWLESGPATPDADDASEPLTEAEREALRAASMRAYLDDYTPPIISAVERIIAAREAAAATKARADERKRIAQAILNARHGWHNEVQRGFVRAARIARGDA